MQCPCGSETLDYSIRRTRDDPGRWRVHRCDSCGRHEEVPLDDQARSQLAPSLFSEGVGTWPF